jgi:hypothetical protein
MVYVFRMEEENGTNGVEAQKKPPPMSQEERMKLCAKLDSELDEYISGLESKAYTEGWPEDRWEEVNLIL